MKTIKILCLECDTRFDFEHPLAMESVHAKIRRQLVPVIGKEAAEVAEIHSVDGVPDTIHVKVPLQYMPPAPPVNLPQSPLSDNEALAALKKKLEG